MYHCIKTEHLKMKIHFLYPQRDFHLERETARQTVRTMMEITARCSGDIGE